MDITRALSEEGACEEDLGKLETRIGCRLPQNYREFLIQHNGGGPEPTGFEGPNGEGSTVHFFFTLDDAAPHYWIYDELDVYSDRIPSGLLPIASDDFGNLVLLDLGAKETGTIYFWDHENENMDGDPWWENIAYISPSFTHFAENLH